jgi:hypothetical protein
LLKYVKSKTPAFVKQGVRHSVVDPTIRAIDAWRLHRAIVKLRSGKTPDRELLGILRRAWGNESFSADVTYLSELAARVASCSGPILECGSGLTTIVAAAIAEQRDLVVWALEQDLDWARHVAGVAARSGIRNTRISHAPLREYDGHVWYDIKGLQLPKRFDLVMCDGPAVFEHWGLSHAQWRYGVLPVLASRGISLGEILLDDATEPRASGVLKRWSEEFGFKHELISAADGDCAVASREH